MSKQKNFTIEVPFEKSNYRDAFILVLLLDKTFAAAELQKKRINFAKKNGGVQLLFIDIHFFLIAIGNLKQTLKKIKSLLSRDEKFVTIYKKYISKLEYLSKFRDHLEHILDGRVEGKDKKGLPLKEPNMLGNLFNDDYNFGGESFNLIETFNLLSDLLKELKVWNAESKVYPLWK